MGGRGIYILRRIIIAIPMLLLVSILSFIIIQTAPGDPVSMQISPTQQQEFSEEQLRRLKEDRGLEGTVWERYKSWLSNLIRGDWGTSFMTDRPVIKEFYVRWPATVELSLASFLFSLILSIPIGIIGAANQYSKLDNAITFGAFFGISMPNFWLGMLLILLFAFWAPNLIQLFFGHYLGLMEISDFQILPIAGRISTHFDITRHTGFLLIDTLIERNFAAFVDAIRHLILPTIVLGTASMAGWTRYVRSGMLENLKKEYVRMARACGFSERKVIFKYALRNSIIPLVTILGPSIGILVSGSVIVETIFAWPGLGRLFINATFSRDYNIVMMSLVIGTSLTIVGNLLADISYGLVDPRVSVEKGYGSDE